ncbi:MAG: ATP synthase F1 subunit delta [Candidatus Acididesulfobacter diazotrophicus]|uniref:ATP synthase subunit delta n=1 Tax=Candidatus Acididesulfobacter diazotrophicus TaxID=2597226 RepID=A0A519BQC3_9DELT|nr:MAG: ATP synthase F1 subunit delta [Candidatus Acididesulfobacter diazotrophicus]
MKQLLNNIVSKRYANALIDISFEEKKIEDIYSQFKKFIDYYNDNGNLDFKEYIGLPFIDKKERIDTINILSKDLSLDEILNNFLSLLVENERINILNNIFKEFIKIKNEKDGIVKMTIISSQKLKDDELTVLKEKIEKILNKKIILEENISANTIGGFLININGKIFDGSLMTQIKNISAFLKQGAFVYGN